MKIIDNILKKLTDEKKKNILLAVGLLGILLIGLSNIDFGSEQVVAEQAEQLEPQLLADGIETILAEISGVGAVSVYLTYESGAEDVYLYEEDATYEQSGDEVVSKTQTEVVLIDGDGKSAVVSKTLEPKVLGVLVVCEGGASAVVREDIISAVKAVFNIDSNRIHVTEMTN